MRGRTCALAFTVKALQVLNASVAAATAAATSWGAGTVSRRGWARALAHARTSAPDSATRPMTSPSTGEATSKYLPLVGGTNLPLMKLSQVIREEDIAKPVREC